MLNKLERLCMQATKLASYAPESLINECFKVH